MKDVISDQLKVLSVHIPLTEDYEKWREKLNSANVDFTKVEISKKYSLQDVHQAHKDLEARLLTGPAVIIP